MLNAFEQIAVLPSAKTAQETSENKSRGFHRFPQRAVAKTAQAFSTSDF
jgi:hypothetical protein